MDQPKLYQDDPTISATTLLFRRIHPVEVVRDENTGLCRVSSSAFEKFELSVDIESIMQSIGKTPASSLADYPQHKLVGVLAKTARELGQAVCGDPTKDNPAHGLIYGKKSKAIRYKLSDASIWIIPQQAPIPKDEKCI